MNYVDYFRRTHTTPVFKAVAALVLVAVVASGCGSSLNGQLREAWTERRAALGGGDTAALCRLLSVESRKRVIAGFARAGVRGSKICQAGFDEMLIVIPKVQFLRVRASRLTRVQIDGSTATTIDSVDGDEQRLRWVLERGRWRIDTRGSLSL